MKRRLIGNVLGATIAVVGMSSIVSAQQAVAAGSSEELKARVLVRKTKLNTQLSNAQATQLQQKCEAAQPKIQAAGKKISDAVTPLQSKYATRNEQLGRILQQANQKKIDTSALTAIQAKHDADFKSFTTTATAYTASIADLKLIDCKNDLTSFKATLDSAREEVKALRALQISLDEQAKGPVMTAVTNVKAKL